MQACGQSERTWGRGWRQWWRGCRCRGLKSLTSWSVLELLTKLLDSSHSWFTGGLLRGMWASQGSVQGLSTSSSSFCEFHLNFFLQEDTGRELHHYLSHGFNILKVILLRYVSSIDVRQRKVIVSLPGVRHSETWRQLIPHLQHLQLSIPKVWPPDEVNIPDQVYILDQVSNIDQVDIIDSFLVLGSAMSTFGSTLWDPTKRESLKSSEKCDPRNWFYLLEKIRPFV